jgi:hypothetical protein
LKNALPLFFNFNASPADISVVSRPVEAKQYLANFGAVQTTMSVADANYSIRHARGTVDALFGLWRNAIFESAI